MQMSLQEIIDTCQDWDKFYEIFKCSDDDVKSVKYRDYTFDMTVEEARELGIVTTR